MSKSELNKQIEKLKNEDKLKTSTKRKLGKIEHLAYLTGHDDEQARICPRCKNPGELKAVLSAFPPTNKETVIGTATDKYYKVLKTPYNMRINNPCQPSNSYNFELQISYDSKGKDISITIPIEFVQDFVRPNQRHITNSEYHYFTGHSMNELRNMRVRCFLFLNPLNDEIISWYGGDQTLLKVSEINKIIAHLTK